MDGRDAVRRNYKFSIRTCPAVCLLLVHSGPRRWRASVREPLCVGMRRKLSSQTGCRKSCWAGTGPEGVCKQAAGSAQCVCAPGGLRWGRLSRGGLGRPSRLVIAPTTRSSPPPPRLLPVTSPPSVAPASLLSGKTLTFPHIAALANFTQSSDDGTKLKPLHLSRQRTGAGLSVPSDMTSLLRGYQIFLRLG